MPLSFYALSRSKPSLTVFEKWQHLLFMRASEHLGEITHVPLCIYLNLRGFRAVHNLLYSHKAFSVPDTNFSELLYNAQEEKERYLMRHIHHICFALFLVFAFFTISAAQDSDPNLITRLTNKEIVRMIKGGLTSELVIAKIKTSRCNFDTDPSQLTELKFRGVLNEVIQAMVQAPYGVPAKAKERVETAPEVQREYSNVGGVNIKNPVGTSKSKDSSRGHLALDGKLDNDDSLNEPKATHADTLIPANSTVFVDEMEGFEHYLMAAMRKKNVPLIVVADPMKADFIIFGNADSKRAGWAKMLFLGSGYSGEMASMTMVNRKTKVVVFSDSSYRYNALRGKRSTAEKLAKYLGKKIKDDQKL